MRLMISISLKMVFKLILRIIEKVEEDKKGVKDLCDLVNSMCVIVFEY